MKFVAVVLLCLSMAACATFGQLETGLKALMGRDAQTAFNVLGYPSGQQQFGTHTVYYWSLNSSGALIMPQTSTVSGYVGNAPVSGSVYSTQVVPVNYSCQIKLVANEAGILTNWEFHGNIGGCESYINRLKTFTGQ